MALHFRVALLQNGFRPPLRVFVRPKSSWGICVRIGKIRPEGDQGNGEMEMEARIHTRADQSWREENPPARTSRASAVQRSAWLSAVCGAA